MQLGVVYNYLPLMIFPLFVALDRLDGALREASKDLGANRLKTFTQVTLPLAMPGVIAGLLLVFIPLAGDYITASVLGGAKGNMAGALVARQFLAAQNWALGSAMAVLLIFVILGTIAIAAMVALIVRAGAAQGARQIDVTPGGGASMTAVAVTPPPTKRRRIDFLSIGLGIWTVLVFVFLFLPIVFIVAHSFNKGKALLVWQGFSTKWYHELFKNQPLLQAIRNSLKVAVGSTLIAVVLGAFAGIALARRGGKWANRVHGDRVPDPRDARDRRRDRATSSGSCASAARSRAGSRSSAPGTVRLFVGHSVFSSAVVTLIVRARLQGLDEALEEAAADLGATPVAGVPPDHAAAHGPGAPRRRPAGVHVQPRQHDRLDVREHRGVDDPPGVRLLLGAVGDQARHRGRGDAHAAAHAVRARRGGVRAPERGGDSAGDVAATLTGN